jgi:hypothetical protein
MNCYGQLPSFHVFKLQPWLDKATAKAYEKNGQLSSMMEWSQLTGLIGFPERNDSEQRKMGEQYANLSTAAGRDEFVKTCATRWSEFARLPYFDLV